MSVPTAIFIDTSILDGQLYNFRSSAIIALLDMGCKSKLKLLLPDPTRREIERHVSAQVETAWKVLENAKRKAPLLAKWNGWPIKNDAKSKKWELQQVAKLEWSDFLKNFEEINLGYEGIDLNHIMNWYDWGRAPFGTGAKRKEFPDALAIAAVSHYAEKEGIEVAVISSDNDLKSACSHYSRLLHFPSLPAFTEAMLSEDVRVAAIKELLADEPTKLTAQIEESFQDCSFYPEEDPQGDVEDVSVGDVEFNDIRVVSLGDNECKVAFEVVVHYSANVSYDDPDSLVGDSEDGYFALRQRSGTVHDKAEMTGIAKITLNGERDEVQEVSRLEFDADEVCVSEVPEEDFSGE